MYKSSKPTEEQFEMWQDEDEDDNHIPVISKQDEDEDDDHIPVISKSLHILWTAP